MDTKVLNTIPEALKTILEKHRLWLYSDDLGEKADLSKTNLSGADLSEYDLRDINFEWANLSGTDLSGTDMRRANLRRANLEVADLSGANLSRADLTGANLRGANLRKANLTDADFSKAILREADLSNVTYNYGTVGFNLACPEEGSFIAFKQAQGRIVRLSVTDTALRSSATTRKIRVSAATVISIEGGLMEIESDYDRSFVYRVGQTVVVPDFDEDRWNECSCGIHCFLTRREAEMWIG